MNEHTTTVQECTGRNGIYRCHRAEGHSGEHQAKVRSLRGGQFAAWADTSGPVRIYSKETR